MNAIVRGPARIYQYGVAIVFAVLLALPIGWGAMSAGLARLGLGGSAWPTITAEDLRNLDRWSNRNFPQRERIFGTYNSVRHAVFGAYPASVVEGRDGWLFYRSEAVVDQPGFDDFAGRATPPRTQLARWRAALEQRRAAFARRHVAYVAAIAPNKHSIYADMLPPALLHIRGTTRLDTVMAAFGGATGLIDLRPALLRARGREDVYFRADTHGNDAGVYAAYRVIMEALAGQRPGVAPLPRECFAELPATRDGDIGRMLGIELAEPATMLRLREPATEACTPAPRVAGDRPTALLVSDSFGERLLPFLRYHFRMPPADQPEPPSLRLPLDATADIVIQLYVERNLVIMFE